MQIEFLGATGTVTGSKNLLRSGNEMIMVDCGLFQGLKELRLRNWDKLPIDPEKITAIILTHAHIDHSGYIPLIIKNGFKGKIYCSAATRDLCSILLPDSGFLQEEEAYYANLRGYSKHKKALPLYTEDDGRKAMAQFHAVDLGKEYQITPNFSFSLTHSGHIIGSTFVQVKFDGNTIITFSGDLGRPQDPLLKPPASLQSTDYLVVESTYGDRQHDKSDPLDKIAEIINHTIKRDGHVIVPSFAVGRAQSFLYYLYLLKKANRIPNVPIYLDSPMAINATEMFCLYNSEHRLSRQECAEVFGDVNYINKVDESEALASQKVPMILVSASGMATGGRILNHLATFLPDPRNTVLFVGYQAQGTRGDRILKGEGEVKIHGDFVPVKAEVEVITNLSAHADADEIMLWLKKITHAPRQVFINHGELSAAEALKVRIEKELGWNCVVPEYLSVYDI